MNPPAADGALWLAYSLVTVVCWGLYGVALHAGQLAMADPVQGRYKAFLFVGIAYFLMAVLAPLAMLLSGGAKLEFPARGMALSLVAGLLGAAGGLKAVPLPFIAGIVLAAAGGTLVTLYKPAS